MRILEQTKQPIFYAKYEGQTETLDNGMHTGDYVQNYSEVKLAKVYISVPKRKDAQLERNGVVTPYRRTLISETDLGLSESDVFSYGVAEIEEGDGGVFNPWDAVEAYNGGMFYPWTPEGQVLYKIIRIEKSFHHTTYIIEEL